jgi:hypothetical protein
MWRVFTGDAEVPVLYSNHRVFARDVLGDRVETKEQAMNVLDGLRTIRERLVEKNSDPETIAVVDLIMKRASLPAAQAASSNSLLQLVRMLARTPQANANVRIYNDFVGLEEELDVAATAVRERKQAEDAKPVPKTKKYYKDLKDRDKKTAS